MSSNVERVISLGIAANTTEAMREIAKVNAALRAVKDPTEDLNKSMKLLNDTLERGRITQDQFDKATLKLTQNADKQRQKVDELKKSYDALAAAQAKAAARKFERDQFVGLREQERQENDRLLAETQMAERQARLNEIRKRRLAEQKELERQEAEVGRQKAQRSFERNRLVGSREQERQENDRLLAEENRNRRLEELNRRRKARADQEKFDKTLSSNFQNESAWDDVSKAQSTLQAEADRKMEIAKANEEAAKRGHELNATRREGNQYMQQFDTRAEVMNRRMVEANELHRKGAINAQQHARALRQISVDGSAMHSVLRQVGGVAATIFGPLTLAIGAFEGIRRSVLLANEYDVSRARLSAFTGSGQAADGLLGGIRNLTSQMPVSFSAAQKSATTMMQYNISSRDVLPMTKRVATVTGGNPENMERMALAFAQVSGAGRLMGQELLQMINAGFNPLFFIGQRTGESMAQLKKRVEEGGVSFEEVSQAIKDATDKTGKFGTVMDEMAKTGAGQWVRLRSEIEKTGTSLGQVINKLAMPALKGVTGTLAIVNGASQDPSKMSAVERFRWAFGQKTALGDAKWMLGAYGALVPSSLFEHSKKVKQVLAMLDGADTKGMDPAAIAKFNALQNSPKLVGEALAKRRQQLQKELKGASPEDQKRAYVSFVDDAGIGAITEGSIDRIKRYRKEIEALDASKAERTRVSEAFKTERSKVQNDWIKSVYGDKKDIVSGLLDQSTAKERAKVQGLILQGKSYETILGSVNAIARAEAERLDRIVIQTKKMDEQKAVEKELAKIKGEIELANIKKRYGTDAGAVEFLMSDNKAIKAAALSGKSFKEILGMANKGDAVTATRLAQLSKETEKLRSQEKAKEKLKDLDSEVRFHKEILTLGKEQALINRISRDDEIGMAEATKIRARQKQLEAFEFMNQPAGNAMVPKAMQNESREAFTKLAEIQAGRVSEQVKLQRNLVVKATAQLASTNRTNDILEKLETV